MPVLISHYLVNNPDPTLYTSTDGVVRSEPNIDLGIAQRLAEADPIWAERGKAIQSYALLEQALCSLVADLGNMELTTAATIFYKITSAASRRAIIEKLLNKRHGTKYNLFWNAYFKRLYPLDIKRNEIVHWLSVCHATINVDKMIVVGVALVPPNVLQDPANRPRLLIADLKAFSERCDEFARLCNVFVDVTGSLTQREDIDVWLDVFQKPLICPLSENHPLYPRHEEKQTPPQS